MEFCLKKIILFSTQMLIIFSVIVVSLYNLSAQTIHRETWIAVLSSTLAYILQIPEFIKNNEDKNNIGGNKKNQNLENV